MTTIDYRTVTKDDLDKLKIVAEIEKLNAERDKALQDIDYHTRNNSEYNSKAKFHNTYMLYDVVGPKSVDAAIREIDDMARRNSDKPLTVIFSSPGGNVLDGLALYDYLIHLRSNGLEVHTYALGQAASMGGVLLQAGNKRIIGKNSWILIHEVSRGAIGSMSELEDVVEFTKRIQDVLADILTSRSSMTKDELKDKWKKNDWWISAAEALELGFVDEVR